jgi:hypothetical protein
MIAPTSAATVPAFRGSPPTLLTKDTSLLPPPSTTALAADAMSTLYLLMSKQRDRDMVSGQAQVALEHRQAMNDLAAQSKALKDQVDAENTAATWGVFAKVAAVIVTVVSAVASVFTCGAASGLLVASAFLSAAAFTESEVHVVGKLSGSDAASTGTSIGLGVASAICSFGATAAGSGAGVAAQAGATVAQVAATSVATSAQAAGTVAASATSVATTVTGCSIATSKLVAGAANIVSGAAQVAQGAADVGTAAWSYAGAEAATDAKQASVHEAKMNRLTDWILSAAKEADKSHERALSTLQGAMQTKGQTLVTASSVRV